MDVIESRQHLHRHIRGERQREAAIRSAPLPHGRTVDELRDHVAAAVAEKKIMDDGDVRMMNLRGQPRLAQETLPVTFVREHPLLHHLDAAKHVEVKMPGLEHIAHPTAAEAAEDLVLAIEHGSRPEGERIGHGGVEDSAVSPISSATWPTIGTQFSAHGGKMRR